MVRTPVGSRCPDCAGVRGLPSYGTPVATLIRATGGGLLVALVTAVLWREGSSWGFYLALILGFGTVELMARIARYKRGADLQVAAFAVITVGLVLSRLLLAQKLGVTLDDLNNLSGAIRTPEAVREFGGYPTVTYALKLRFVPDILFAAMPYAIAWYRFR